MSPNEMFNYTLEIHLRGEIGLFGAHMTSKQIY